MVFPQCEFSHGWQVRLCMGMIFHNICNTSLSRDISDILYFFLKNNQAGYIFTIFLNPFPNRPCFLYVCSTILLKTQWEKKKLLVTSNFSLSHRVFYPLEELYANFIQFEVAIFKLFQFGPV